MTRVNSDNRRGSANARLDDSCLEFIGRRLSAKAVLGTTRLRDLPARFGLLLRELERDSTGALKGGLAVVDEPGSKYDKHFLLFSVRYQGIWDFKSNVGEHNIYVYPAAPEEWKDVATGLRVSEIPRTYEDSGRALIGAALP